MAEIIHLSEDARDLLRIHCSGRSLVMGGSKPESLPGRTVPQTLTAYRELVAAGLMDPVSSFAHGPESHFRLTKAAFCRREEWLTTAPSLARSRP
jgi:hypothetical protein